jgi:photosystem II stability/assembly factor-like uncharacterized protein
MGSLLTCATAQKPWWPESSSFYDVFFINPRRGWVVGFSGIIATQDGGTNWQVQFDSTVPPIGESIAVIHKVIFLDEQEGWAIGTGPVETGLLFHTTNGGENWDKEVDGFFIPRDIQFVNRKEGWMTKRRFDSPFGKILHTNDGGLIWQEQYRDIEPGSLFFLNNRIGWVAAVRSIYHTTDGGATWERFQIGIDMSISDLFFLDELEGWAVSSFGGIIIHTVDGGRTWEIQEQGQDVGFAKVYFTGSHGWAIGQTHPSAPIGGGGIILHTEDSGQSWRTQLETSHGLCGLHFFNSLEGWVVGSYLMLHTLDGGRSWEIHTPEGVTTVVSSIDKKTINWGQIKQGCF